MPKASKVLTALTWIGLCVVLTFGVPADGRAASADLTPKIVVDAFGKEIGQVYNVDFSLSRIQVAMEVQNEIVFVLVEREAFTHGANPVVFFELPDCVGTAYMAVSPAAKTFGAPSAVAGPTGTLYLGVPATEQSRELASAQWSNGCEPFEVTMRVMDALPLMDLTSQFTPPFRVTEGVRDQEATLFNP